MCNFTICLLIIVSLVHVIWYHKSQKQQHLKIELLHFNFQHNKVHTIYIEKGKQINQIFERLTSLLGGETLRVLGVKLSLKHSDRNHNLLLDVRSFAISFKISFSSISEWVKFEAIFVGNVEIWAKQLQWMTIRIGWTIWTCM